MTWPRRVESLRLTTSIGTSSRSASSNSIRPMRVVSSTASASGRLRVLVRMKQVEPADAETGRDLVRLDHGDHVDAVDRLRSRGVVVQDRDPSARVGQGAADPPPGVRLHPRWGRFAVGSARVIDVRRPGGRR